MADVSRVLLLGYGLAGRTFHAPLIAAEPGLDVTTVVTADPERRAQALADLPHARILATAEEALADPTAYDLVVVATANSAHVPQARAALERGLSVVVDKPLAGTAREAIELIDMAESRGLQLHVFQNRRWDSEILTARRLIDEGLLGRVHRWESRFERWRPTPKGGWREQGSAEDLPGLLYDLGAHLVDQSLHVVGPVEAVVASVRAVREGMTTDDDTQVLLWHTSGAVSILSVSSVSAFIEPRLRVLGTRGGLEITGLDTQEDALRAGRIPTDPGWGVEPEAAVARLVGADGPEAQIVERSRGAWQEYYAGVVRSLRGESAPPVDPRDVVANLRVIEAAAESARSGSVVRLDPPAAHS
ncbi:MAG: Gfo/Idh/MocA family oxidoreductase [Candidatus Nanopelagicales bacterium]